MVIGLGLTDYITFEINASIHKRFLLWDNQVYFHPKIWERLGMAVVEAMAELIPIVPIISGPTKFVPKK